MPFSLRNICGTMFLVAALGVLASGSAWSAAAICSSPAPVAVTANPQWIRSGVEVLFDPRRDYRLQQVSGAEHCARFTPIQGTPNFGYERQGVWLRFRLSPWPREQQPWRLLIPSTHTDRTCVHWPLTSSGYQSECGDVRDRPGTGPRTPEGWYFAVPETLDLSRPILLYTQGVGLVRAPLHLGTADALLRYQHARQTWAGAYYGLLLGTVLFGLALFAVHKERTYLYFSIYMGSGVLYLALSENDLGAWGISGWLANRLVLPVACVVVASATPFFQHFLETRAHTPALHRWLWAAMALIVPPLLILQLHPPAGGWLLAATYPVWMALLLAAMLVRIRQGSRAAVYALLAFGSAAAAAAHRVLEAVGLQLIDVATATLLFYAGWLLYPGFLLVGLVDRMRRLAQERDGANQLAVSSQRLALHHALYDELTRLPNRAKFREDLHELLGYTARHGHRFALVMLGLDHFSAINHALGHKIGDSVLNEIAERLKLGLPDHLLLARVGPDLFAWITGVAAGESGIAAVIQRCEILQSALAAPLQRGDGARLTASLGVALYPDHAGTAEQLLQCSDTAVHCAKAHGRGGLQLFDPIMHQSASRFLELNRDLHQALDRGQLELHYQPIVALAGGELLGVEALARWRREDGRFVAPDQFVPVAEAGDLLRPFTEWTIRTCCQQMADWRARGIPVPCLSFNLSPAQMRMSHLEAYILQQLRETGVPGMALTVEVTEGALLENLDAARAMLSRLRLHGLSVAVDDFGIGYASPHYLRVLPVNILKIDGSFLQGVPEDPEATSLLNGIIDIGRSLQLKIVTEVVETPEQAAYLRSRGVTAGQGFWFSHSLTAAALEAWMQRPSPRAAA